MTKGAALVQTQIGSSNGIATFLERLDQVGLELSQISLEEIPYAELVARYRALANRMSSGLLDEAGAQFLGLDHGVGEKMLEAFHTKQGELEVAKTRLRFESFWESIRGNKSEKIHAGIELASHGRKAVESARSETKKTLERMLQLEPACDSFVQLKAAHANFREKCNDYNFLDPSKDLRTYFNRGGENRQVWIDSYKRGLNSMMALGAELGDIDVNDPEVKIQVRRIIECSEKIKQLEPLNKFIRLIKDAKELGKEDLGATHRDEAAQTIESAIAAFQQLEIYLNSLSSLVERKLEQHVQGRLKEMSARVGE